MSRRLPSLALAGAALAAVALPIAAQAAVPTIRVWNGKTEQHKDLVTIFQEAPGKAVNFSIVVSCKMPSGKTQAQTLTLRKLPKNGKVSAKTTKALGAAGGKLTVSTTAVAKRKAVGTATWELPAALGGCKGSDSYSLKYSISHGG